jgi:DNA-binding NtrC family response regulator
MSNALDLKSRLIEYERSLILAALAQQNGNQRRAAAALGVLPTTLHEKMKRLGLKPAPVSAEASGEDTMSETGHG